MKCAIITAGGCGTRLYPLSTKDCPKQFVKMFGDKSLLQLTYERVNKSFDKNNIFIVLPMKYKHFVLESLPFVKEENIILEPAQMSTAPCILYSCLYIRKLRGNVNTFVFPADHYITDNFLFNSTIKRVEKYLNMNEDLVLFGIKPTAALSRYGYLKVKDNNFISSIRSFKEKPNKFKATLYTMSSKYYWSSDIYGFRLDYMIQLYKRLMPKDYELLTNNLLDIKEAYKLCTPVSTAYGIFEKVKNVKMIKCSFDWDDVGVFESLLKYTNNQNVIDAYNQKLSIDLMNKGILIQEK